ncbi:MAG TPA: hypothetical protein VGS00_00060 [Thermoanaerobaculia bacterium]|nr:hypothetical protein [Thermoanaerobaculia bacterium]
MVGGDHGVGEVTSPIGIRHGIKKVKPVSLERRRAMRQQDVYLDAVRQLKPANRARVKAIRSEKGFRAAISEARKLAQRG